SSKEHYQNTFEMLAADAIKQYRNYLPASRIEKINEYIAKVEDYDTFYKGVEELFAMANAGAGRSNIFGGRYERKLNPKTTKIIHQSITGLRYRDRKSTRLNSSHVSISYAVFCLKKKKRVTRRSTA